ncbi:MAG: Ppx/GppA family phosphatase [Acidobacteriia bacterium]|nr:Ppx/GppA family phosphatase [Terriglobia bacterium]
MKIAAIDVGSNSIHMILVESHDGIDFEIVDREKEMVRLGSGVFETRLLSEAAMVRAEQCLRNYRRLAERLRTDRIIAYATSAVREARNGGDFISRIHERVGIHLQLITSAQEARLITLAVQQSINFRGRRALLIDIGGGSVELSLCDSKQTFLSESRKLGVIRLTEKFISRDPITNKGREAIEKFVLKRVSDLIHQGRETGFAMAVGTSGTILTLADLAHQIRYGEGLRHFNQQVLKLEALEMLSRRLLAMTLKERLRFEGVNLARATTIVAGAILLETLMKAFRIKRLTLCTRALREGMVLDFLQRSREPHGSLNGLISDVRRRSVLELARRSRYDQAHSERIAQTALQIFDATRRVHRLNQETRELLEYGALLHDIGILVSYTRHHRHSQYIILNSGLRGFTPREIDFIGLLARFHRKGEPSRRDPECALMPRKEFERLRRLSAILRVADGIDRSHNQILTLISLRKDHRRWRFEFEARDEAELELWGAQRKGQLFEKLFGGKMDFRVTLNRHPHPTALVPVRNARPGRKARSIR